MLMETSLHRQLKAVFGGDQGCPTEVSHGAFRADVLRADGEWVEIQSGPLAPLRAKLQRLLPERRVLVVKPIVVERRIVKRTKRNGPDVSVRLSPRRGTLVDVFDDLVGAARIFPHTHLRIDLLAVAIDEIRTPRRRFPRFRVIDRSLREIREIRSLSAANDLWGLLPADLANPFTTLDLAKRLARPIEFAQRVAYCLRLSGAAYPCGKNRNRIVYRRGTGPRHDKRLEVHHECA
jgi:hypothetical protein